MFHRKSILRMDSISQINKEMAEMHIANSENDNMNKEDILEDDIDDMYDVDDIDDILENDIDDYDDYKDYCEGYYDYDEYNTRNNTIVKASTCKSNVQKESNNIVNYQPRNKLIYRFEQRINLEKYEDPPLPSHVTKELNENDKRIEKLRIRTKDKKDRATVEQVLDPRTRMILYKLLNNGVLEKIDGCISTGKEANVYYAKSKKGADYAIKIFKTSILHFKDRDKYVTGEFRFRHGYSRRNPRKMVETWAEKEARNLHRLEQHNVKAPRCIRLHSHVLVMEFIGNNGIASPKLKDVTFTPSEAATLYRECIEIMWRMYNKCKLVHADLSEFNMLYQNESIVIIDVAQAVEHEHPNAMNFLKTDCTNITGTAGRKMFCDLI